MTQLNTLAQFRQATEEFFQASEVDEQRLLALFTLRLAPPRDDTLTAVLEAVADSPRMWGRIEAAMTDLVGRGVSEKALVMMLANLMTLQLQMDAEIGDKLHLGHSVAGDPEVARIVEPMVQNYRDPDYQEARFKDIDTWKSLTWEFTSSYSILR